MSLGTGILPEFDHEMAVTRRLLERVPAAHLAFKPHPKSFSLGELATHVATIPHWSAMTIQKSEVDMGPPDAPPPKTEAAKTTGELLERFDAHVKEARDAIGSASDATLLGDWSLLSGGKVMFTMPRIAVLRSFVMNHLIHHRGQLSVYCRMCDVPLPSIYGNTADETGM